MTLRDFLYAVTLAETGKFNQAADRCRISQPTLSAQIAKLEDDLGVQLFERGTRHASVTLPGRALIDQMRVILDEVQTLKQVARTMIDPLDGPFFLGAIPTIGPYLIPRLLPVLRARFGGLKLTLIEERTDGLMTRLRAGTLDAALISPPIEMDDLKAFPILREDILLAIPAQHRLAEKTSIAPSDLGDETLLMLEEGHCLRAQSLGFCRAQGLAAGTHFQATSLETLRQMVMAGIGPALLPAMATTGPFAPSPLIQYRPFGDPVPRREIMLVWRKRFPRGDALTSLGRLMADHLAHGNTISPE